MTEIQVVSQGYPLWVGWYAEGSDGSARFGAAPVVAWKVCIPLKILIPRKEPVVAGLPEGCTVRVEAISTERLGAEERVREWWRRKNIEASRLAADAAWRAQYDPDWRAGSGHDEG